MALRKKKKRVGSPKSHSYIPRVKEKIKVMKENHLRIAKMLIELRFKVEVISIEFEDGAGNKFLVTTKSNPLKKQFIVL